MIKKGFSNKQCVVGIILSILGFIFLFINKIYSDNLFNNLDYNGNYYLVDCDIILTQVFMCACMSFFVFWLICLILNLYVYIKIKRDD